MATKTDDITKIALFQKKEIRKVIYRNEWWFSIIDVVKVLSGTDRPRKYWNDLKNKIDSEGHLELSEKIGQLKLTSTDGKLYRTDCANTETIFRIIQSIPSPKAEPFKLWLAKVGYERIQEIEDPELAQIDTNLHLVIPDLIGNLYRLVHNSVFIGWIPACAGMTE